MKNNHVKVWVALMTFSYLATLKFPCRFQKLQKIEENDQYRSGIAGYICCIIGWFGRFPTTKIARSFWCIAGEQMNSYSVVTTITSANKCSTLTTTTSKTPCSCRWCRFPQFIAVQQGAFMWDRGVPWGWAKWIHVCPTCMWSLGSSDDFDAMFGTLSILDNCLVVQSSIAKVHQKIFAVGDFQPMKNFQPGSL